MRNLFVNGLIIAAYCIPFVYIAMYRDYAQLFPFGYLFNLVVMVTLAFFSKAYGHWFSFVIGNSLSSIVSFYFIQSRMKEDLWSVYFKPFTPIQMFLLISVGYLLPQLLVILLTRSKRNASMKKE